MADTRSCTNLRNAIRCVSCDARLLAECLRDDDDHQQSGIFGFRCPVCVAWNPDIRLQGFELLDVFPDPRAVPRDR